MVGGRAGKAGWLPMQVLRHAKDFVWGARDCVEVGRDTPRALRLYRVQLLCAHRAGAGCRWLPSPRHLSKHDGDDAREEKPPSV